VIKRQIEAFNRRNARAFADLYLSDAIAFDPRYLHPLRGKAAIEEDMREFFAAFPDAFTELQPVLAQGNSLAFELKITGSHGGPLRQLDGEPIVATHRRVEMRKAVFVQLTDSGLIAQERRYFDMAGLLSQLGVAPRNHAAQPWGQCA
jgi:steroid delta-isomerase-like uncharacterized protein